MAKPAFDYNEVSDRVRGFNEQYPNGTVNTFAEVMTLNGDDYITVRAVVRKDTTSDHGPDATGLSWLKVPGSTNFTRGSEIENAETSAVGRALAFIGFYAKGESLASKQEIAAKKGQSAEPAPKAEPKAADEVEAAVVGQSGLTQSQRGLLFARLKEAGITGDQRKAFAWLAINKHSVKDMTSEDLDKAIAILDAPKSENPQVWENIELVSGE